MPTRQELDAIAPAHPVHLQATYDVVQLNTLGIAASGITGQTTPPPGASIETDAQGNFTGVLRGTRGVLIGRDKPPAAVLRRENCWPSRSDAAEFNAAGLTGDHRWEWPVDHRNLAGQRRRLSGDVRTLAARADDREGGHAGDSSDAAQALSALARFSARLGDDMFWFNSLGENVMIDVWSANNYPMKPTTREEFTRVVEAAVARNVTIQIHSQTEPQLNTMLDVFEHVHARMPLSHLRFTLLHAELITPAMIERMKRLGMGVMIQARQLVTADSLRKTWGNRIDDAPIVKTVFESGLPFGGGTDGMVAAPFRPFMALYW